MKLIKQKADSDLFNIEGLTDDELIAEFNICINYKSYLQQIMTLPNATLLTLAPGESVAQVRANLKAQEKYCNDFIMLWKETIEAGGIKNMQN
jgi:hypothetical protein